MIFVATGRWPVGPVFAKTCRRDPAFAQGYGGQAARSYGSGLNWTRKRETVAPRAEVRKSNYLSVFSTVESGTESRDDYDFSALLNAVR